MSDQLGDPRARGGTPPSTHEGDLREEPIGELLKRLSTETTTLVKMELDLAKAEMAQKGKEAGLGAGLLSGGAIAGLMALGSLTAFLILLLDGALANWLAALVVTLVWGAIAGVLALQGKNKLQDATPPAPEQTIETVKEDVQWAKTREAIRQDIERQRDEMSETIDAIGYKADVPSRTREAVSDKVDAVKGKVGLATGKVSDATPSGDQVKGQAKQAVGVAKGNPIGLAIGAIGVGFLAGMLIPETQKEHAALGSAADKVKGNVADTASEALEHGKQVAQETAGAAKDAAQSAAADVKETAQSSAQEHGQQVKETAQENAQDTAGQVKDEARQASPTS